MASGARDTSGQLGRNYMYHAGAMAVGLFAKPTGSSDRFTKQVGFTDLYLGDGRGSGKLGYAQALPIPGPRSMAANLPFPLPLGAGRWLHDRAVTLAGAVEDLPQTQNRVELTGNGLALHHRFHPYDVERSRRMAGVLTRVLRASGAVGAVGVTADRDDTHTAHQVGTCRFGEDPEHAVLDRDCRMHGYDNLYVLDGAFMPTSLGAPPALTIIANALRVGAKMLEGTT
jgi:choline dehydrogenase-like flavoprotein